MWEWPVSVMWRPFMELLRNRPDVWGKRQQRALQGLIQNPYWCQARVGARDPSASSACQLCQHANGLLYHRRFQCDAHAGWRRDTLAPELKAVAEQVGKLGYPFADPFARGRLPDVAEMLDRPPTTHGMEWVNNAGWHELGAFLEPGSLVFVDGSGIDQAFPRLRTARQAGRW